MANDNEPTATFRGLKVPPVYDAPRSARDRQAADCSSVGFGCLGIACEDCILGEGNLDAFIEWEKEQ